jgi:hypothetical protein
LAVVVDCNAAVVVVAVDAGVVHIDSDCHEFANV